MLRPLHEYERQGRIRLTLLPFTGDMVRVRDVEAAITAETRLMVMTHGSNVLGSVQDIRAIGRLLHDHGIYFIVDGAQTLGHIPVNMQNLPVDAYVFTGHKALFGVSGIGGFYLRDPESISPVRFGGTGTDSSTLLHPRGMPERFEAGTPNYPGLAALAAGVKYIRSVGLDSIVAKAKRQTAYIIRGLQEIPTVTRYTDRPSLPIVSFNVDGIENDDVGFILARAYGIVGRTGLHCAPLVHQAIDQGRGAVRLSLSWFTTDEECRTAADAIREIAGHADPAVDTT